MLSSGMREMPLLCQRREQGYRLQAGHGHRALGAARWSPECAVLTLGVTEPRTPGLLPALGVEIQGASYRESYRCRNCSVCSKNVRLLARLCASWVRGEEGEAAESSAQH